MSVTARPQALRSRILLVFLLLLVFLMGFSPAQVGLGAAEQQGRSPQQRLQGGAQRRRGGGGWWGRRRRAGPDQGGHRRGEEHAGKQAVL